MSQPKKSQYSSPLPSAEESFREYHERYGGSEGPQPAGDPRYRTITSHYGAASANPDDLEAEISREHENSSWSYGADYTSNSGFSTIDNDSYTFLSGSAEKELKSAYLLPKSGLYSLLAPAPLFALPVAAELLSDMIGYYSVGFSEFTAEAYLAVSVASVLAGILQIVRGKKLQKNWSPEMLEKAKHAYKKGHASLGLWIPMLCLALSYDAYYLTTGIRTKPDFIKVAQVQELVVDALSNCDVIECEELEGDYYSYNVYGSYLDANGDSRSHVTVSINRESHLINDIYYVYYMDEDLTIEENLEAASDYLTGYQESLAGLSDYFEDPEFAAARYTLSDEFVEAVLTREDDEEITLTTDYRLDNGSVHVFEEYEPYSWGPDTIYIFPYYWD